MTKLLMKIKLLLLIAVEKRDGDSKQHFASLTTEYKVFVVFVDCCSLQQVVS